MGMGWVGNPRSGIVQVPRHSSAKNRNKVLGIIVVTLVTKYITQIHLRCVLLYLKCAFVCVRVCVEWVNKMVK